MSGNLSKMPRRCVVGGCSNTASLKTVLLFIAYLSTEIRDQRPRNEGNDGLTSSSSRHFQPTDFEHRFNFLPGQSLQFPRLKMDEFGVSVYSTVHADKLFKANAQRER